MILKYINKFEKSLDNSLPNSYLTTRTDELKFTNFLKRRLLISKDHFFLFLELLFKLIYYNESFSYKFENILVNFSKHENKRIEITYSYKAKRSKSIYLLHFEIIDAKFKSIYSTPEKLIDFIDLYYCIFISVRSRYEVNCKNEYICLDFKSKITAGVNGNKNTYFVFL